MSAKIWILIGVIVIITTGVAGGYFLTQNKSITTSQAPMIKTATEVGSTDTQTFRDTATGTLQKGGLKGTGTHHLDRDGGPSQTVYVVSSIVDLDEFVGKKVQIWGESQKIRGIPWFMDVGRLKIIE